MSLPSVPQGTTSTLPASEPQKWLRKIQRRYEELSRKWLKDARKVVKKYEAEEEVGRTPFNILYSNTQTLMPALYNSTPRAEVSRRYTQADPQQKTVDSAISQVVERFCEYTADTNHSDYETYSEATQYAVLNSLVPGLGTARVRLHQEGGYQQVCFEAVQYDRFVWPKTRKWSSVSWVAFGHDLGKAEFEATYPEFCRAKEYQDFDWETLEKDADFEEDSDDKPQKSSGALLIWELWDADNRRVVHLCSKWPDRALLEEDYPEKLTGKFPCPRPLMYAPKLKEFGPTVPYQMYEAKAEELNRITARMMRIVKALRVRGIYNSANPELQGLFQEDDDNILVPSESSAAFQDGIDKSIWFMPIDMLVAALNELYIAQQNCLQTIYQIMGISDVQRGATDPNETAKAQEIKNSWGGLRTKMHQKTVQMFCRDLFRIAVEFGASYFTTASWAAVTKVPLLFDAQKAELQRTMMQHDMQQQAVAEQAQAMGQQPPPPAPPPIPPTQEFMLSRPSWEQVVGVLQDNFERTYRIDVETNSTIDLEATEDKQAIAEFMNAFGQMMAGLQPLLDSGVLPFEAAKAFMMEVTKRFRFGRQVEVVLDQMAQPPQGQEGDPAAQKARADAALERVRAEGAKRLLEAEQTITRLSAEVERLNTELTGQKVKENITKESIQIDQKGQQVALREVGQQHKEAQFQQKADYQGKLLQNQKQSAEKDLAQKGEQQQMSMQQMFDQFRQEVTQMVQQAQVKAAEDGVQAREKQAAEQMQQMEKRFLAAMDAFAKASQAPKSIRAMKDKATGGWTIQSGTMQ